MSIPRPKILSVVECPSGGWAWDIYISNVAQYDTHLTGTVAAGDYFVSGDNQSDDLLRALTASIQTQIDGSAVTGDVIIGIDPTTHKVELQFYGTGFVDATGDNDVKLTLTSWATGLAAACGFDTSADDTSTTTDNPTFTADWHHGYGFYCDEDAQGQIVSPVARSKPAVIQAVTPFTGNVKSIYYGERYLNALMLQHLERYDQSRTKVHSDGNGYGDAPVWPYNRNEPLECWYHEAKYGRRFRVYSDGYISTPIASDGGTSSACAVTTLTDASKSWSVEPHRWPGRLIWIPSYPDAIGQAFYISSHTATVLTVPNAHPSGFDVDGGSGGAAGGTYYLFEHPYETYILDVGQMSEWDPKEIKSIDRYNLTIPLLRYES